jgi:hypothetical protein
LLLIFIVLKVFKFCIQFIKIQWKSESIHNEILKKIWIYFLMFMLKIAIFEIWNLSGRIFWSTSPCLDLFRLLDVSFSVRLQLFGFTPRSIEARHLLNINFITHATSFKKLEYHIQLLITYVQALGRLEKAF